MYMYSNSTACYLSGHVCTVAVKLLNWQTLHVILYLALLDNVPFVFLLSTHNINIKSEDNLLTWKELHKHCYLLIFLGDFFIVPKGTLFPFQCITFDQGNIKGIGCNLGRILYQHSCPCLTLARSNEIDLFSNPYLVEHFQQILRL